MFVGFERILIGRLHASSFLVVISSLYREVHIYVERESISVVVTKLISAQRLSRNGSEGMCFIIIGLKEKEGCDLPDCIYYDVLSIIALTLYLKEDLRIFNCIPG